MSLQEWANIATIIGSFAVVGLSLQVYIAHKQVKSDHERSRREKSVDILMEWAKNLKKEGSVARKIVECLSEEQCRDIFGQNEVKINKKHANLLVQLFGKNLEGLNEPTETITLSEAQSTELRWHVVSYLNSLEFTLVAWQYSVVDKKIIESQFGYLFRPSDGHEVLKNFRKVADGSKTYPAIEIFTAHLSQKERDQLISKANVA